MTTKLFFSFRFDHEKDFVRLVHYYLRDQPELEIFCWLDAANTERWRKILSKELNDATFLVAFVGEELGETQRKEIEIWEQDVKDRVIRVQVQETLMSHVDQWFRGGTFHRKIEAVPRSQELSDQSAVALHCAREIIAALGRPWLPGRVPTSYVVEYEKKDIVDHYVQHVPWQDLVALQLPLAWPEVKCLPARHFTRPELEKKIGSFRSVMDRVLVDARAVKGDEDETVPALTFQEAGPRGKLVFDPQAMLNVMVVVSGGIAPGINAVVDGIVSRHLLYAQGAPGLSILGCPEGFGSINGQYFHRLHDKRKQDWVAQHKHEGGSILGTSRFEKLAEHTLAGVEALKEIVAALQRHKVHILYVIGGDGSMRAAQKISAMAEQEDYELSVVGIPKTMDNDILWVWQSFGFMSAVERARDIVEALQREASSNPRLAVVQLFGSDSGFVASHTALGSGACDLVLVPEVGFVLDEVFEYVFGKLTERYEADDKTPFGMILMAETAIPVDWEHQVKQEKIALSNEERMALERFGREGRISGQTPDVLREAGLRIVSTALQQKIRRKGVGQDPQLVKYWQTFRVFTNQPRHIIRAMHPSVSDVLMGQRLGALAVDNAMGGYREFMVSQWLTEYVLVPLELVTLGRKRLYTDGVFWKTVCAATGQPVSPPTRGETPSGEA